MATPVRQQKSSGEQQLPSKELGSEDAKKTYRYLRIGLMGAVVLLAASILIERSKADCWQTSLSAYYYTPVQAIFVGWLFALGLSLIVYKGRSPLEDVFLNFAGMLAPVVAVAPTMDVGRCWSSPPTSFPVKEDGSPADWVLANIDNNFYALLIAGAAGLIVATVIAMVVGRSVLTPTPGRIDKKVFWSLVATLLALGFGWWLIESWDDFYTRAHGFAAVLAFVLLIFAIIARLVAQLRARQLPEQPSSVNTWFFIYAVVAGLMIIGGIVISIFRIGDEHTGLVLEAWEIVLFAVYWIAQTAETWGEEVELEHEEPSAPQVGGG